MCGICGIYAFADTGEVDPDVLSRMAEVIRHRGPDDEGFHLDGPVGLGNRRLSIIDLPGGKQPVWNEDRDVVVVFNGEIYNYRELTAGLKAAGHRFSSASDTEVIVHLYEAYGVDCVHHLRGMFSFAVWDTRRRRLFLARDRLGIKPLYWTVADGTLVFGSEIKSILEHPAVSRTLDPGGLTSYLALKYVPAPQTMFAGISALEPGHRLTCDEDGPRVGRYWDLSFAAGERTPAAHEEELAERLRAVLEDSVRAHLVSDVPFGAFLSGGLDSSLVVALMSRELGQPVQTFSVGFEGAGEELSELPYARLVAERYETDHHEVILKAQDFPALAEKIAWHLDQPIADDACLASYLIAGFAARHVKMVLTGEGGDELFAGYARYAGERLAPIFRPIPAPAKRFTLSLSGHVPKLRRPKLALYALSCPDEVDRLVNWFPLFNDDMRAELLTNRATSGVNGSSPHRAFAEQLARTDARSSLNRMLYVDTKLWLPDDLLARGDKMSMAVSLEARVPLLDHHVVEFAAAVPPGLKLKGLTRKYLLRKVAGSLLPPEIVARKKKGFPIPVSEWFRGEAREFVRDTLSSETLGRRGLLDPDYVERLLDSHERGFGDHGSLIWGLLNLELWQRIYLDSSARHAA